MSAALQYESVGADQPDPLTLIEGGLPNEAEQPQEKSSVPLTDEQRTLAEGSIGLVYSIAAELLGQRKVFNFEETVADGLEGLCRAAQKFDPARGLAFSTYADKKIRGRMKDGYRELFKSRNMEPERSVLNGSADSLDRRLTVRHGTPVTLGETISVDDVPLEQKITERLDLSEAMTLLDGVEYRLILDWAKGKSKLAISQEMTLEPSRISQIFAGAVGLLRMYCGLDTAVSPTEAMRVYLSQCPGGTVKLKESVDTDLCAFAGIQSLERLRRTIHALEQRGLVQRSGGSTRTTLQARKSLAGKTLTLTRLRDANDVALDLGWKVPGPLTVPQLVHEPQA